jgi:hypothetical protein
MVDRKNSDSRGNYPDITNLIRSVQRLEGNPDCFGKSDGNCEHLDCAWRELCLKESQKNRSRNEGGEGGDPRK